MGNHIAVPYSVRIPEKVQEGTFVTIRGRPFPSCTGFSINLCSGPSIAGEVPLHFNPRFDKGYVCCNNMQGGRWASEQHTGHIPFVRDVDFEMKITAQTGGYMIEVNNNVFCQFAYRLPKEVVQFLVIAGDVQISSVVYGAPSGIGFRYPQRPQSSIKLPYSSKVPSYPVKEGFILVVKGRPLPDSQGFSVNLCSNPNLTGDVPLHVNPRFDKGYVCCNSLIGGQWGPEEKTGRIGFARNVDFVLTITAQKECYVISLQDSELCRFSYRLPKDMIHYVYIVGDVYIDSVNFGNVLAQSGSPPPCSPTPGPIINPTLPLSTLIPGGMCVGKIILISGRLEQQVSRFSIHLMSGNDVQHDDLPFIFDVRLRYGSDVNVVVRNHRQRGQYGVEERDLSSFPFYPKANVDIMILAETDCFKVAVNDVHFTRFNHRMYPFEQASFFNISGDIAVNLISFQ